MKDQVRAIGIDDASFTFQQERTEIVGVVARLPGYVEQVASSSVAVDGDDANERIAGLIAHTDMGDQLKCIFLDGAAVGGFNVVDIEALHRDTGIPVITVTREKPDMDAIREALQGHFDDWETRYNLLSSKELCEVDTGHNPIHVSLAGIELEKAKGLITSSIIRGAVPEPLRLAHLIASRKRL